MESKPAAHGRGAYSSTEASTGVAAPRLYWLGEGIWQRLQVAAKAPVLVVDDDAEFLSMLRCCGLSFAQQPQLPPLLSGATSSCEAPWDVALVSLDLPGFVGLIAITRLRNLFPRLRICATIDVVDPERMVAAMCAGANDYLIKRVVASAALDAGVLAEQGA